MRLAVGITLLLAVLTSARVDGAAADPRPANPSHAFPLWFESHHGAYVSRGAGYALSVSPGAAVLALRGGTVRMRMLGGSVSPHMEPLDPLPGHATWCAGGDACETFATYGQVLNRSVYPGIDVVFYGNQGRLEYDFRVAAGSSARRIALAFEGARRMQIDNRGDLLLNTGAAEIRQSKPIAYQLVEGRPREVAVAYRLDRAGHVRFRLGQHDSRRELVIDPALIFDNQVGASAGSAATALALDAQGNVYVAGQNYPLNSRITGPPGDLFIDKWNAAGNQLIYSTNLGGSGLDVVSGLAVDAGGSAYLYGTTTSTDFPVTANAFQKSLVGIRNAFVVKASPDGTRLVYSSLLGGGAEQTGGIAVDSSGAAYVIGTTFNNFPTTPAAFQPAPGATCNFTFGGINYPTTGDAFVAKISPDGSSLLYSSYLGGSCGDFGYAISVNTDGTAWVAGATSSPNFPVTPDALQPAYGASFAHGFLARISAAGDRLDYSTFLGNVYAQINAIARDAGGNLYLTGSTAGFSQPASTGAYQAGVNTCFILGIGPPTFYTVGNAFVMALNPLGTAITGLTYLGSPCTASGTSIGVDSAGAPWIAGSWGSGGNYPPFPTASPIELGFVGFISKFSPDLTQLLFSTNFDTVNGLALDANGLAWVAGTITPFPPPRTDPNAPLPPTPASHGYLAKIDPAPSQISLENVLSASPFFSDQEIPRVTLAPGKVIRLTGTGIGPAATTPGTVNAGVVATAVAGVQVTFDGIPAPLLYVSSNEIGCIVPYATTGRSATTLQVTYNGMASNLVSIPLQAASPDVLAVFNADSTPNSASSPAQVGDIVELYVTGAGQTVPATVDGQVYASPLPQPANPIQITFEGLNPVITFAAAADGLAGGILQVNFQVPPIPAGVSPPPGLFGYTLSSGTGSTRFTLNLR